MTPRHASALILVLSTLASCGDSARQAGTGSAASKGSGVAVFCALNVPDALNPFVNPDQAASDLTPVLFTPLVMFDSAGAFRPYLARSWTWSADRKNVAFTLRTDFKWHDGRPVTPDDVVWTITAAADSAYPYWGRGELSDIERAVVNGGQVEVSFRQPFAADLEPFARLAILPRHLLDTVPAATFRNSAFHREPVGSGPFRFAGRLADGAVRFDRVADFPEDAGRARLERLVLREVPEPSAILVQLSTRSADLCSVGSSIAAEAVRAGNRVVPIEPAGSLILGLDNRKAPFNDVRVRRAMSAALRRSDIAAILSSAATPARNFMPDEAKRWRDASLVQPDNDPVAAAALLDSAGWRVGGADGIRRNSRGQPLSIAITAPAPLRTVLTVVQSQLRTVGVDAELRLLEPSTFYGLLGNPKEQPPAIAVTYTPGRIAVPDPYPEFHSGGDVNLAFHSNRELDTKLERLRQAIPDEERARLYIDVQRYIATEVPVVYTVHTPRMLAVQPRLRDVKTDPNGPFASVAQWHVSTDDRR